MYTPTAKGYFSGCGGMEIGLMQAGVNLIQSLDISPGSCPHHSCSEDLS
jgi:DNA (cytosine-5)-methyltransferase 1